MNAYADENPEVLESEIEATRSHLNETIDAIERKLSPGQLLDEGIDYFRHNGSGEFFSNLGRGVRHNPMPVTLAGVGIGWLMLANRTASTDGASARASKVRGEAGDKAKAAAGRTREAVHGARERMHNAREGTRELGRKASDGAHQAADQLGRIMHEQPLVVGALGIALGAVLAAGLPSTGTEDRFMGGMRDDVVDKAAEVGEEQAEKVRSTAQAAGDAAREQAGSEGLTQHQNP